MGLGSTIDGGRMAEKYRSSPWVELAVPIPPFSRGSYTPLLSWCGGEREAGGGSTRRPSSPLAFHSPSVFQSAFLWSGVGRREEGDVGAVRRDGFAFVLVVRFFEDVWGEDSLCPQGLAPL